MPDVQRSWNPVHVGDQGVIGRQLDGPPSRSRSPAARAAAPPPSGQSDSEHENAAAPSRSRAVGCGFGLRGGPEPRKTSDPAGQARPPRSAATTVSTSRRRFATSPGDSGRCGVSGGHSTLGSRRRRTCKTAGHGPVICGFGGWPGAGSNRRPSDFQVGKHGRGVCRPERGPAGPAHEAGVADAASWGHPAAVSPLSCGARATSKGRWCPTLRVGAEPQGEAANGAAHR